jgi:hypothetical protein
MAVSPRQTPLKACEPRAVAAECVRYPVPRADLFGRGGRRMRMPGVWFLARRAVPLPWLRPSSPLSGVVSERCGPDGSVAALDLAGLAGRGTLAFEGGELVVEFPYERRLGLAFFEHRERAFVVSQAAKRATHRPDGPWRCPGPGSAVVSRRSSLSLESLSAANRVSASSPRASYLATQRGLSLRVAGDPLVVADSEHRFGDPGAKPLPQVQSADVGLLDQVVHGRAAIRWSGAPATYRRVATSSG